MALAPSQNTTTDSGCFSAILHRLLCRNGVPTHPSLDLDHALPPHSKKKTKTLVLANESSYKAAAAASSPPASVEKPGIVARLMGLETLPDFTTRRRVDPETVPRSRSVNFMDYLITAGVEIEHATIHQRHRRVRTSVSFREVVVPRQQSQQDDLLVLYLDELAAAESVMSLGANSSRSSNSINGSRNAASQHAGKEFNKQKKDSSKLRDQKSSGRGVAVVGAGKEKVVIPKSRKEPVVRGKQCSSIRVKDGGRGGNNYMVESEYNGKKKDGKERAAGRMIQHKEVVAESKFITKKKKQKKSADDSKQVLAKRLVEIKTDDIWESLTSHISGLDHQLDHHGYYSNQGNSTPENMKSYLRKSSSTSWRDECSSPPEPAGIGRGRERFKERRNSEKVDTPETHNYSVAAAIDHVCRLTEEDIINNAQLGTKEDAFDLSSESYREEICVMIEQRILNIIMDQLVGDLLRLR